MVHLAILLKLLELSSKGAFSNLSSPDDNETTYMPLLFTDKEILRGQILLGDKADG